MGKYKDNPWLGLESYQENQIIYGRNKEISELSQCVLNNNETVLYGKSGIGKSSIINAGILPVARANGYIPVIVRLDHSNMHSYIKQINDQICKSATICNCSIDKNIDEQLLWEYFHTHEFKQTADSESKLKLLIVFDQFEEIFTLQDNATTKSQFFKEIGDVLNDVMPKSLTDDANSGISKITSQKTEKAAQVTGFTSMTDLFSSIAEQVKNEGIHYIEDNDIHFVFTLREDFLSEFEYFTTRIPSLKQHRYGLRPLNEEQAAEIIMKPRPELVDEGVARLIIETITNRIDFSLEDEPEIDVDAAVLSLFLSQIYDKRETEHDAITIDLIKTFGKDIIKDFYEESIEGLSPEQIDFLEEELLTSENRRDSLSKSDFKAGGFTNTEIKRLVEEKKLLRQFHYEGDLRIEFIHDVLCNVVKERKEQRAIQRQQEEERLRQEEEKRILQEEAEKKQREIEEKAAREKAELEAETKRIKQRNQRRLIILSSAIAFLLLTFTSVYYCFMFPYSKEYGNFTTKNGWPIGLGTPLSSSIEKENCTVYYKLSRDGRLSSFWGRPRPFTKVEILNWAEEPATNVFIESPVVRIIDKELDDSKAAEFAKLLSRVSYWQYTPDANGLISMKTAFDINGQELYSENYSSTNGIDQSSKHVMWGVLYDKNGNALQISDNGTDRIRYTVSDGYITGCSFFTVLGTPQPNTFGDYGYSYQVDSISGNITSMYKIDKFGDRIDSTQIHYSAFEKGRYTKSDACSVVYSKQNVIWEYKGYNDTIHMSDEGFIDCLSVRYKGTERIYAKYKSHDDLFEKKRISNDTLAYSAKYFYSTELDSIRIFDNATEPQVYEVRYSHLNRNVTEKSYWCNGKKIMFDIKIDNIKCHKIRTETAIQGKDSTITTTFYDCDNLFTKLGAYSKSVLISERESGRVMRELEYDYDYNDEICKSEMWTYNEYGIRESRAVAGIDRTPVRCSNWDWDGWSYYKMSLIRDFNNIMYVAVKGVNEYGGDSYITDAGHGIYMLNELPLGKMNHFHNTKNYQINGLQVSVSVYESMDLSLKVPFLHILNKKSVLYSSHVLNKVHNISGRDGLYDNDILFKIGTWKLGDSADDLIDDWIGLENYGGNIQVLRYIDNKYVLLTFSVEQGDLKAEYHFHPINNQEYEHIKDYIK
ncbi:MAG: hypothetical protein MJZ65_01250 [Paludibacteraceae bacterium]|nr:hypothetical protein [Paludibacteraceae bacterium]